MQQLMPSGVTQGTEVDHRMRVGDLHGDALAHRHVPQRLFGAQDGQGAVQSPQVQFTMGMRV